MVDNKRIDFRISAIDQTSPVFRSLETRMGTERFRIVNHDCGDNTTAGSVVGLIGADLHRAGVRPAIAALC